MACIAAFTALFFGPLVVGESLSNAPPRFAEYPQADQALYYHPSAHFVTSSIRDGAVPLWNPYSLGGTSFLMNGEGSVYPVRDALALIVDPITNHDLLLVGHVFAAGLFMFLFLKALRLRFPAAVLGALAWMYSSWNTTWMQDEAGLALAALLPLVLLLIYRAALRRSWRTAAAAGLPLALMASGVQLSFMPIVFVVCGAYAVALALWPPNRGGLRPRIEAARALQPLLTLGIGVGAAAAILLPTVLNAGEGGRAPLSYSEFLADHTLQASDFVRALSPVGYLNGIAFSWAAFVGIVPLALAFVGFVLRKPGAALGRWLAVGTFLFAIGAPVVGWLAYHLIPGVSRLSSSGYELWAFDLGIVVLGSLGFDAVLGWTPRVVGWILRNRPDTRRVAMCTVATISLVAIGLTGWQLVHFARFINPPFTARADLPSPHSAVTAALEADRDRRPPDEPQRVIGVNELLGATSLLYSVEAANGYDNVATTRTRVLWLVVQGVPVETALRNERKISQGTYLTQFNAKTLRYNLLARAGITTIFANTATVPTTKQVAQLHATTTYSDSSASVIDLGSEVPRAWVVHEADVVPSDAAALRRFADPDFDVRARLVVEPDANLGPAGRVRRRGSGEGAVARRERFSPNQTSFTVRTETPGWLVMADMYSPGWHATVNGRDAKLTRANYTFRAVAIPAGRVRVVLTYHPPGFAAGGVLSAIAVLALTGIGLEWLVRRRRARRQPEGSDDSKAVTQSV